MSESTLTEEVILDACVLINLFASGRVRDILQGLPVRFIVARYVSEREALYVLTDPTTNARERIDLAPFVADGLILIEDLDSDDEINTFVDLTTKDLTARAKLEDGEAATCALARHRGYTIATDERKVLNLVRQTMPARRVRSTSELVKSWSEVAQLPEDEVSRVVRRIQSCARFAPNRKDPLYDWWDQLARSR